MQALVLVEIMKLDKTFTYNVPTNLVKTISVGKRVLVPFSSRQLEGFVVELKTNTDTEYELKDILEIIDEKEVLNEELLKLGKYISKKTLSTLTSSYQAMLPKALKAKTKFDVKKKFDTYIELVNDVEVKGLKQIEVIQKLKESNLILKKDLNVSAIKSLLAKGIVKEVKKEVYRLSDNIKKKDSLIVLNKDQELSLKEILKYQNEYKPFLLFGVTGSGKTEVYMHAIKEVLKNKKEAIVLVPEISLTPQMIKNFKERFGDKVAVIHSGLSDGEKYDEWRKIERQEVSIVVGARSAIFAPFKHLGIIIIDEEHSDTYKQENNPRYDAKDIASVRAKYHKCPLVLGSATPSIETYTKANIGIYNLLTLKSRINNNLPIVKIVDMKEEIRYRHPIISRPLYESLTKVINSGNQAIILLNRRGYSTTVTCHNCGFTNKCPNCDIPLIYHKKENMMMCHYCDYKKTKLSTCPSCQSKDINTFGLGTEKLEEVLSSIDGASVIRMDIDTTKNKGAHEKILASFRNEEYNILLGTQMISKGLDFPKVTLVGVVSGDASLNIPDFRSAERTFSLLNQVAGRSGRNSIPSEVIIQTYNTDHYSIIAASKNDYEGFYNQELNIRKTLKYPPYYNLCLVKISGKDQIELNKMSDKISNYLRKNLTVTVLGPSYDMMPKLNNVYHMHIILKYKKVDEVYDTLKQMLELTKKDKNIKVDVDFNPLRV